MAFIGAVATLDGDLDDLHPIGQLGLARLLRPKEIPRQQPRQNQGSSSTPTTLTLMS